MRSFRAKNRAQTVLEYVLMLAAIMVPLGLAIRSGLEDKNENEKDNLMRQIVNDAYGDEDQLGVIGRPYP